MLKNLKWIAVKSILSWMKLNTFEKSSDGSEME